MSIKASNGNKINLSLEERLIMAKGRYCKPYSNIYRLKDCNCNNCGAESEFLHIWVRLSQGSIIVFNEYLCDDCFVMDTRQ